MLSSLIKKAVPSAYGPRPAFVGVDLLRALRLISLESLGRKRLSERLGVGEGSMRTLLGILSREGFVRMTKAGCRLTPKGSSYWYRMMKKLRWMGDAPKSPLTFHLPAYGLMVSGAASVVKRGLEERDAAIREGALGATVLVVEKNRLFFPGTRESSGDPLAKSLLDSISAQNGDALVLSYGPSRVLSERGAWAAALNWLN